jgi:hypothetical protein
MIRGIATSVHGIYATEPVPPAGLLRHEPDRAPVDDRGARHMNIAVWRSMRRSPWRSSRRWPRGAAPRAGTPCTIMGSPRPAASRAVQMLLEAVVDCNGAPVAGVVVPNDQHCVYQRSSMLRLVMSTMMGSRVAADA